MPISEDTRRKPSGFLTFVWALFFFFVFALLVLIWVRASGGREVLDKQRAAARLEKLAALAKVNQEKLDSAGWIDQGKGIVHLPISDAKRIVIDELKAKKVAASSVKVEATLPMPPPPDPLATEPPPPALPSAPQGAEMVRFDTPRATGVDATLAPAASPAVVSSTPVPAATPATPAATPPQKVAVPAVADPAMLAKGKMNYMMICVACHQPTGAGLPPVFPPLTKSEYVSGSAERLAAMILKGNAGPMTIDGKLYNNVMPGQEAMLDDAKIASVMTYVRASFGNNAPPVTPEMVGAARKKFADRKTPWTEPELKAWNDAVAPAESAAPVGPPPDPSLPPAAPAVPPPVPSAPPSAPAAPPAGLSPTNPGASTLQPATHPVDPPEPSRPPLINSTQPSTAQ